MPPDEAAVPQPAAAEASAAPETATPAPAPSPDESFQGLGQDFDDLDVEVELAPSDAGAAQPPPAATTEQPEPPEAPAPSVAPPAEAAPPVPKAAPQPPPAEGPKETPPAAASPPLEPRTLVEQITQHRGDILNELAQTRFAWDAGEKKAFTEALETDAAQALVDWAPKLMARMYYESATMALNHINQFVPVLMNNYTQLMEQQKNAESEFFKQFPQLNKQQHWNDIIAFAQSFNRAQPQITQADLLAMVGAAVMAKNKLVGLPGNGATPPARKPAAPAFVPAQAGGASPVRVVTEPESPWQGLGQDFEE